MANLLRYSIYYVMARGLPGLFNFLTLICLTRLLSPYEYGRYSMVMAGVGLGEVIFFQWLKNVLGRYLPGSIQNPGVLLQPVLGLFSVIAVFVLALGSLIAFFWPEPNWRMLIAFAALLVVAYAWMDLNLTLVSAQLEPKRYGLLLGLKSVSALLISVVLAYVGLGAYAPLAGLFFSVVLSWWFFGFAEWRGHRPVWPEPDKLKDYMQYGLPLVASFALVWVVSSSDRLLIAWLLDEAHAGLYTVGYDLADQSIGLVLAVINLAAYPLAVHKMEREGQCAAREQLSLNGQLVVTVAMVCAVGLIGLAPALATVLIGSNFSNGALQVLPLVAVSAAVAGVKAYHFDVAFLLTKKSRWLVFNSALAALFNVVLNLMFIRRFGIIGAAWSTLAAFTMAAMSSYFIGRKLFPMPSLMPLVWRGALVSCVVALAIRIIMQAGLSDRFALLLGLSLGGLLALGVILLLDVGGFRKNFFERVLEFKSDKA